MIGHYIFNNLDKKGYTRSSLKGEEYPAITFNTNDDESQVNGILVQGLTENDIKALDVFEGEVTKNKYILSFDICT